jgi:hypothetical protein
MQACSGFCRLNLADQLLLRGFLYVLQDEFQNITSKQATTTFLYILFN